MRDLLRGGCVCLVLGALLLTGQSWSDVKREAPRPRTRIGLVNLSHVINNYDKIKAYREEMKKAIEPFQAKELKIKAEAEKLLVEMKDENTTAERKTEIDRRLKGLKRDMEELKHDFTQMMSKKQEQQAKIVYKDVEEAVRRHAKAHDLELVLHYNDATKEAERDSPQNIIRKLQAGTCMPIYAAPGIDVSEAILANLNASFRRRKEAELPKPSASEVDLKKMQGTWEMTSCVLGGKAQAHFVGYRVAIRGNVATYYNQKGEATVASTLALGANTAPKSTHFTTRQPWRGMAFQGIYHLEGDTLKLCDAGSQLVRPDDFDGNEPGRWLSVLKRAKP